MTREEFEQFVSAPPYARSVDRIPTNYPNELFVGQYENPAVQLAWDVLQEAERLRAIEEKGPLRTVKITLPDGRVRYTQYHERESAHPAIAAVIEEECATCAPGQQVQVELAEDKA